METKKMHRYLNHYHHCFESWQRRGDCMDNDRCPVCDREIEPMYSREMIADVKKILSADEIDINAVYNAITDHNAGYSLSQEDIDALLLCLANNGVTPPAITLNTN
jgi:DNA repair exonuclease SbcCD ATPase subunit